MHDYKKLTVWREALELVNEVYEIVELFPIKERFILTQQMLRAAISIPSNIAEGAGRGSDKEFIHFLSISKGSSFELETQLEIALRRKYLDIEKFQMLSSRNEYIQRMLTSFQKNLSERIKDKK
ncbi:MAG: four helix bundle protein [Bacteroidia bacterium]